MHTYNILYRVALGIVLAVFSLSCSKKPESVDEAEVNAQKEYPKITVQLDWVAEPEHGGFYQAEALGYFEEEGLDVEIIQGGANAYVHQKVASNKAQFGQAGSTSAILAISRGLPLVNVAAVFQDDPAVLMMHEDNPISSFEELDGKTLMARPEWVFLTYLKKTYHIDFEVVPQNFGIGHFKTDPLFIQQGYYIAEPYFLKKEGVSPKYLYAWDAGFDSYTVIISNREFVDKYPEATRAFLRAYVKGYKSYLLDDPTPAHEEMLKLNPKVTDDFLLFSRGMIISEELAIGRGQQIENLAKIDRGRFAKQIQQLENLGILEKEKVTVDDVMISDLIP
jgi:NitT/TauT family transport system substrate-binding protein